MAEIVRTEDEIDAQAEKAWAQVREGGSRWPGMTYEQGVANAIEWLTGDNDDPPMED